MRVSPRLVRRPGAARLGLIAVGMLVSLTFDGPAWSAEFSQADAQRLAVDVVWLRGGGVLRGAVLDRDADRPPLVAVSRDWLRQADPKLFAEENKIQTERSRQADVELKSRLDQWILERPDDVKLAGLLRLERQRCEDRLNAVVDIADPPAFLLIEMEPERVRKSVLQPADRRRAAGVAWHLGMPNVETTSAARLASELDDQFKDWKSFEPDLSERVPPLIQSDGEWRARQALWEYAHRQACDFQGTGDVVIRTDAGAGRPDVLSLIAPVLESTLKSQLSDLLEPGPGKASTSVSQWRSQATAAAAAADVNACRVTRVDLDPSARRGRVTTAFLVCQIDDRWDTLWEAESPVDPQGVKQEAIDRLKNDPQIKSIGQAFSGLGAGGELDDALRFGAAVQAGQQACDTRFFAFRDVYLRRLSGPPLRWARTRAK